jgi:DNA polymerase-3 subunit gamma/tau
LHGIRGVGKTTTARIIAKTLNCSQIGEQGYSKTIPCDECKNCRMISESTHVDVLEMDAASRTGVDDIREITNSVHYQAAIASYRVYIIDEVHMLSKAAFNALLKTLEEPPPHVKFILATTDIRKIPATILSRCLKFDLKRVEARDLIPFLTSICEKEGVSVTQGAVALIAKLSEGSVRDSLSLLEQAISYASNSIDEELIRKTVGLGDPSQTVSLFYDIMIGNTVSALEKLRKQYADGCDPFSILKDVAEICHRVSVLKFTDATQDAALLMHCESGEERKISQEFSTASLARVWQMAVGILGEIANSPFPLASAEMAIIRLTHLSTLPTPAEVLQEFASSEKMTYPSKKAEHVEISKTHLTQQEEILMNPIVHKVMSTFPDAQITNTRET